MMGDSSDYGGMKPRPKPTKSRPRRSPPKYYIGEWIRALGAKPADIARELPMNEGYLSEIISGKKDNPSAAIQADIANYLKIPASYFLNPPPSQQILKETVGISAEVLARLRPH